MRERVFGGTRSTIGRGHLKDKKKKETNRDQGKIGDKKGI